MAVEVFPLVPPGQAFPMDFWNNVIHAADDAEGGAAFSEGADTVYRMRVRNCRGAHACRVRVRGTMFMQVRS